MRRGRCEGCGVRGLVIAFRGWHCMTCVAMAEPGRGEEPDADEDARPEPAACARALPAWSMRRSPSGGRKRVMTDDKIARARELWAMGSTLRSIATEFGVSLACIQRYVPTRRTPNKERVTYG